MRILQLIDTLHPGGAERMALNYFHALKDHSIQSFMVVTREMGLLGEDISNESGVYFLKKKNMFDVAALWRLKNILSQNKIDIVQAHGSSWFFAALCKITGSKIKIIWHDHYGKSEFLKDRPLQPLKFFSKFFDGIISVNYNLKEWTRSVLKFRKPLIFLPNFINIDKDQSHGELKGETKYKLVCVANLRPQKDHENLLKAFDILKKDFSVSLHLFGRDYKDAYSKELKRKFHEVGKIFYYGETKSIFPYLRDADIGILSSLSEGLPLALIEYGLAGLPVVCTNVGECSKVTGDNARLIPSGDPKKLAKEVAYYLNHPQVRMRDSAGLNNRINELYSETRVVARYLHFIEEI